jgi:hypothetical protein
MRPVVDAGDVKDRTRCGSPGLSFCTAARPCGGCQRLPDLLAFGDVPEIASLIAPRPCLCSACRIPNERNDLAHLDPERVAQLID